MEDKFKLEKFKDRYIIFPTSKDSSLSDKDEIKKLVSRSGVWEGTILIDMLLIRGDKLNRFIEVIVKFGDVRGLQMTYGQKREVRDFCFQFYRKNFEMVENSNLRPFLQNKMKKNKYF